MPDPLAPSHARGAEALITLTSDADYEYMRGEHGARLELHLEIDGRAQRTSLAPPS